VTPRLIDTNPLISSDEVMTISLRWNTRITSLLSALLASSVMFSSSGCAMFGFNGDAKTVHVVEDAAHPVVDMICLWQPAEGHDLEGLPCRGFAGQILFMAVGEEAPVEVGGDVAIYVFDDHGTLEEQQRPLHIFEFPGESWSMYLREAGFGSTYQLFIPYTRRTTEVTTCNLRIKYTSPEGRITYSKMIEVSLPGTARRDAPADLTPTSPADLLQAAVTPNGTRTGGSSEVSLASHEVASEACADCANEAAPESLPNTLSSQIALGPAQLAGHQLATLDHILLTLDETPAQAESTDADSVSTPSASSTEGEATDAPAAPAPRSYRLHPLAE
jgi:hypothetical protein